MIDIQNAGAIATLTMGRPPVNAIDCEFVAAFERALAVVAKAKPTALVICSSERCFSAGADLALIGGFFEQEHGARDMVRYVESLHGLFRQVEVFPAITIAAIAGPALGGGLELALACDLRVAARGAKLGLPEARVGLIPAAGGTQRLTRLCGQGIASRLILGGEVVDGAEAERIGLVQWCVEDTALDGMIRGIAERVASLSREALTAAKDCILAHFDPRVDGYAREIEKPAVLMTSKESKQRVQQFLSRKAR